ncbi:hypothetical protein MHU86_4333 [Fragilaria crotonensis]|nr:hypothetical protein MHU86_4333 [Fragilaria crotonensis]
MTTPSSSFESPMRRSNRVRGVTPELSALEEDPFSEPPRKKAKTSRSSRTSPVAAKAVSDKERKLLENLPDWLNSMEEYLSMEENLSRQNLTSVMRQVVKLSTGVGITYSHWGGLPSPKADRLICQKILIHCTLKLWTSKTNTEGPWKWVVAPSSH